MCILLIIVQRINVLRQSCLKALEIIKTTATVRSLRRAFLYLLEHNLKLLHLFLAKELTIIILLLHHLMFYMHVWDFVYRLRSLFVFDLLDELLKSQFGPSFSVFKLPLLDQICNFFGIIKNVRMGI